MKHPEYQLNRMNADNPLKSGMAAKALSVVSSIRESDEVKRA
jgi:hypothetical protein